MGTFFRMIRGGWIDHFIPEAIKADRQLTTENLIRTRCMIAILGVSIMLPLAVLLTYILLDLLTEQNFGRNVVVLTCVEVVLITQHLYFQSYGNLRITAAAYSLQFIFIISIMIFISGGWARSPLLILLICSPLIAAMTISNRAAIYHALLVLLIVTALWIIHLLEIEMPNIGREGNYHYTRFISWVITLIYMIIFLVFNEHLRVYSSRKPPLH